MNGGQREVTGNSVKGCPGICKLSGNDCAQYISMGFPFVPPDILMQRYINEKVKSQNISDSFNNYNF